MSILPESNIIPKKTLANISPFYVDFDKSEKKTRVSARTRKKYDVYLATVHPVGYDETTYRVELFETEYITLKIMRDRGIDSYAAELSVNPKTGFSDVIFSGVESLQ